MTPASLARARALYLEAGGRSAPVLAARTGEAESILASAFDALLRPVFPSGLALAAVGGFGRRELFPYSDIDLLLLVDRAPDSAAAKAAIAEFLRTGWDAGLRLSHSVHTVADCCEFNEQNVELTVSLLDQRFLAGDEALWSQLATRLPKFFQQQRANLVRHLGRLARARCAKYQDTIYHLEPNLKETPGGLRDYHLLHWLDRAGAAGPGATRGLESAWDFLSSARVWLHLESGRDVNLLNFELQDSLCALPFSAERDPAAWMRSYFRHARAVFRASLRALEAADAPNSNLLRQFRDWRSRLSNADFTVAHERVLLRSPGTLAADPGVVLRLFAFVARHGLRLAPDTERRIDEFLPKFEEWAARTRPLWPALEQILAQPHAAAALGAMQDSGALAAVLPEWRHIDCLVVRDFYHSYTVDEHCLVAASAIGELRKVTDGPRRRFTELLEEVERPAVLLLSILLHDLGKGAGEGRHAELSIEYARPAMGRLGVPPELAEDVVTLIERHLDLSAVMTSRDLTDPGTGRWIADRVGTIERLKLLTLLTYADISAVHPTAMTPWRLEQLWRAYLAGSAELTRELDSDRIHETRAESPALATFLEGFPTRYLRTHTIEQIRQHQRLSELANVAGIGVDLVRREGTWYLSVVTKDRTGLFASIAGALSSFGMNILKAEAFANAGHVVLDTFAFADTMRTLELNPSEVDRLRQVLVDAALGRADIRRLLRGRPATKRAPGPQVEPRIAFDSETSDTATLIELVAQDRPGLLYDVASTLSSAGCNIEVVLIDTEANKALDVFYVTSQGRKLDSAQQEKLKSALLALCG